MSRDSLLTLVALSCPCLTPAAAYQEIVYVDVNNPPGGDGTSWETAFQDLQDGLDLVLSFGGDGDQVWVAEGTYLPTELLSGGETRTATWRLTEGHRVFGGFTGTETSFDQRDPSAGAKKEQRRQRHLEDPHRIGEQQKRWT